MLALEGIDEVLVMPLGPVISAHVGPNSLIGFVMGKEKALDYWREYKNEFDTVLVEDNGNITITDGLKKVFKSNFKFDIAK